MVTTEEELAGLELVRSALNVVVESSRVVGRDSKSYFAILLDDNNRRPICRLRLDNPEKKHVGLFEGGKDEVGRQVETKVPIEGVQDISKHADQLRKTALSYVAPSPPEDATPPRSLAERRLLPMFDSVI